MPDPTADHIKSVRLPTAIDRYPSLPPHPLDEVSQSGALRLWLQVDCRLIAELLDGRAVLESDEHKPIFTRVARKILTLHIHGFRPISVTQDFVIWSPREFNSVADHAVNATMDENRPSWGRGRTSDLKRAIQEKASLRVCIDGGRRSSSLGALGFAVYAMNSHADAATKYRVVLRGGKLLEQVASAFLAEALAIEWTLECLVRLVQGLSVAET